MSVTDIPQPDDRFAVIQNEMDWFRVPFWESVFSLSNGLLGARGSFEESMPGVPSRPMSFMAGLYNTLPGGLPELPMLPNWLTTRIVLNGAPFDLRTGHIERFTRWLDMKRGLLAREVIWQSPQGESTRLTFVRFLSLADRNLAVLRVGITPLNWSGPVAIESSLTMPAPSTADKKSHWTRPRFRSIASGLVTLETRTRQTRRPLAVAAGFDKNTGGKPTTQEMIVDSHLAADNHTYNAHEGETCEFDRFVVFLAGEPGADAPTTAACDAALAAVDDGFDKQLERHVTACADMWERMDVEIDGPADDQRAIRFNLFQLATLCPPDDYFASIGPKGLTGTAYLGHIFWDTEIYMVPFFSLTNPAGARTLLSYRYETLPGARRKAKAGRHRGARYAWESADTGEETCPRHLPDPAGGPPIRIWCGDIQEHITADVPYAIDRYVRATGDEAFLWDKGAEIFFETARFWASRVTHNDAGRYDILDVMGPDEFHIHVDNDAYTNYLARWNLLAAADLYDNGAFPKKNRQEVIARVGLKPAEPGRWREIADKLVLLFDEKTRLIDQSEGFLDRPELSPDILRLKRRGPITELTGAGIVIECQVLKQAEVVIMQALLEDQFDRESREANFDYYEPRTSHDSSLSVSAHAWAAARIGRFDQAYDFLRRSAFLDLDDLAGNTADGLHTANMGGLWLAIVFGLAGLSIDGDTPAATPRLPADWRQLRLAIEHRGQRYTIECTGDGATIRPK